MIIPALRLWGETARFPGEGSIENAVNITNNQTPMVSVAKDPMPFQKFKPCLPANDFFRGIFRFPERKRPAIPVISALLFLAALLLLGHPANGIERRKPQFLKDSSYLILPLP